MLLNFLSFTRLFFISLFLVPLFFSSPLLATTSLEIIVNAPQSTSDDDALYLTGNTDDLCNWQPACVPLQKIGVRTYKANLNFKANADISHIEFKVTRGTWNQEAADNEANALNNFELALKNSQNQIILNFPNWKDKVPLGVTGIVDVVNSFYSPELQNRRTVSVWLPPQYKQNPHQKFPVLYMHDGQNSFDPKISYAGIDWGIDETMTELITQNLVNPAIVVAIDCTSEREDEYDYTAKGKLYAEFLVHTLKPFIDKNYRTQPQREATFTMGSSMGALISLSLLWTHPEVFSVAAGISMPAFYKDEMIIKLIQSMPLPLLPIQLYFDHGDQGEDADYAVSVKKLNSALLTAGLSPKFMSYKFFPWSSHNELDWSRRVQIPLQFMLSHPKVN